MGYLGTPSELMVTTRVSPLASEVGVRPIPLLPTSEPFSQVMSPTRPPQHELKSPGATVAAAERRKGTGGRPPKYAGPSRPVTLTLPESTLEGLKHIHPDRGQAIVKLTEAALRSSPSEQSQVEIVRTADATGVLLVGPSQALRRIPFLHLLEVSPGRFLLAMEPGNDFRTLELALRDVAEDVPSDDVRERNLIEDLLVQINQLRKTARMRMAEIVFVELSQKGRSATLSSLMSTLGWLYGCAA